MLLSELFTFMIIVYLALILIFYEWFPRMKIKKQKKAYLGKLLEQLRIDM